MAKLEPGTTKRRWEPEKGIGKHNERIHKESKFTDTHKNLPFKFSKPSKPKRQNVVMCSNCGYETSVPVNTVGMICIECSKYVNVEGVE